MASESRERMIHSAVRLLGEHGYSGTGFREVIAHSGAPRGSIYHHFPEGKAQLGVEAVEEFGRFVDVAIAAVVDSRPGDPLAAWRVFVDTWRSLLIAADFRVGCPVVAVAVEAHDDEPRLAAAATAVFGRWRSALAALLIQVDVPEPRANRLANTAIAAIEGAVILCRAQQNTEPLDDIGVELEAALRAAIGTRSPQG